MDYRLSLGMIAGVWGLGNGLAAWNPVRHWLIVLAGLLGKLAGLVGFAFALAEGSFTLRVGFAILTNNPIVWISLIPVVSAGMAEPSICPIKFHIRAMITTLDLIHLTSSVGFCTLLWVVQLVVYPQMASVREEDFSGYHARHTRSIMWLVGPLFFAEGLSAAASFWLGWKAQLWGQGASVILFAANSALTFLWFVPAHTRLARGKSEDLLQRLVSMNRWRTALSSARVLVVTGLVG
jgi:hypothetical protein